MNSKIQIPRFCKQNRGSSMATPSGQHSHFIFIIRYSLFFALIVFGLLGLAEDSWAVNYYVDYDGGNDLNSGTSQDAAWKHCPGDLNATNISASTILSAGDIIYFKKGVTYRGQITVTRNGAEVDFGSNAAVTAGGIFTSAGQNFLTTVQAGDLVYIYNGSNTGEWVYSVGLFAVASVDSHTQLTLSNFDKISHPIPEMTYRIWKPITYTSTDTWGTGDAILSGHNDSDVPSWYYMVRPVANYLRFSKLKFQDTKYPDGYPGSSCTNAVYGALWNNSANKSGIIIDNNTFTRVWRINPTSALNYQVVINNTATDIGAIGYEGSHYSLVENNTVDDSGGGIRGIGSYSVIRGNRFTNCAKSPSVICGFHSDGIGPVAGSQYSWIISNYLFNTLEGIYLTYYPPGNSNITVINNVLIGNYGAGSGDFAIFVNGSPNTRIYNNTIFGVFGTQGWLKAIGIGACGGGNSSPNSEVKNNLIYIPDGTVAYMGTCDADSTNGFVSDNNIIYIPNKDRGKEFLLSGVEKNFAEWQTARYDAHGSISQPSLVDITGSNYTDFDLQLFPNDTVAKDKGASITYFSRDINNIIRPQGTAWDIGAYEYVGAAPPPDTTPPEAPTGLSII